MTDSLAERRATAIAHHLLTCGCLDLADNDDAALYEELMGNGPLYDRVGERLVGVGYDLHQFLGHLGVRPRRETEALGGNTSELHAGHIRLLVYLWVQLVYRQIKAMSRDEDIEPLPGQSQGLFGFAGFAEAPDDAPPELAAEEVFAEFREIYSDAAIKQFLGKLRNDRFIVQRRKSDPIVAGPALYVLVDPLRMEEYVVGLARRGTMTLPDETPPDGIDPAGEVS